MRHILINRKNLRYLKTQVSGNPREDAMVTWKRPIFDPYITCTEI